ncbi:MAG: preprotein translocase subunit YajC [Bifidobacteriaceae bacterium]|nr:preprotein translocase subunit YajC [Bifidobacteriaceae bacterium]
MSLIDLVWLADETPTDNPSGTTTGGGLLSGSLPMLLLLGGMILVMWFMSRRNKKKQQQVGDFRRSLEAGQRVMTVGGMIGTITKTQGDVITIMSPEGDQSAYVRRAIRSLVPDDEWEAMIAEYPDEPEDDEPEDLADGQAPDETELEEDVEGDGSEPDEGEDETKA